MRTRPIPLPLFLTSRAAHAELQPRGQHPPRRLPIHPGHRRPARPSRRWVASVCSRLLAHSPFFSPLVAGRAPSASAASPALPFPGLPECPLPSNWPSLRSKLSYNLESSAHSPPCITAGYWEPAKYVAKLRELRTNSDALLLLKCDMGAGHFRWVDRPARLAAGLLPSKQWPAGVCARACACMHVTTVPSLVDIHRPPAPAPL